MLKRSGRNFRGGTSNQYSGKSKPETDEECGRGIASPRRTVSFRADITAFGT